MRKEESHMKLVNLGNGNVVNVDDVSCVFDLNQMTDKQYINRMRETGNLVRLCTSKMSRTAVLLRYGCVVVTSLTTETVRNRIAIAAD